MTVSTGSIVDRLKMRVKCSLNNKNSDRKVRTEVNCEIKSTCMWTFKGAGWCYSVYHIEIRCAEPWPDSHPQGSWDKTFVVGHLLTPTILYMVHYFSKHPEHGTFLMLNALYFNSVLLIILAYFY